MAQGRRFRCRVRRIDTWTVLRFSLLFYSAILVVSLVAGLLLWLAAASAGMIDNVEEFVKEFFALETFGFNGGALLRATLVFGIGLVLLGTGANVLMSVLYNLTSDVVGGVEVEVSEDEVDDEVYTETLV